MTCFLAKEFPNAHIVSVDRNQLALDITRKNLDKFKCSNVELINTDVNALGEEVFDTVFSMRTVQENRYNFEMQYLFDDWRNSSNEYIHVIEAYVKTISQLIRPEGAFVSIERLGIDPFFLGYLKALSNEKIFFNENDINILKIKEPGEFEFKNSVLPVIAGRKGVSNPNINLEQKWLDLVQYNPNKTCWHDGEALVALEDKAEAMVEGYYVFSKGKRVGKFANYIAKNKTDKAYYLCYMNNGEGGDCKLVLVPKSDGEKIKTNLNDFMSYHREQGFDVIEIKKH